MRKLIPVLAAVSAAGGSVPAFAQATGPDYSSLTNAVDFGTTTTAVLAIGALAVTLALVTVGIRKILRMIRSA